MHEYVTFAIYYALWPALILYSCRLLFGSFKLLTFHHIFVLSFLVLIYLRALDVYSNDVPDKLFLIAVLAIPWVYLFAACIFSRLFFPFKAVREATGGDVQLTRLDVRLGKRIIPVTVFFFVLPLVFMLDQGVSNIALFFALSNAGDYATTMELRIGGLDSNISPVLGIIYGYSRALFYPVYCSFLLLLFKNRLVRRLHLLLGLSSGAFFSVLTAAKAPLAYLLLSVLLAHYYHRRSQVDVLRLVIIFCLILAIPALFYPLLVGATGFEAIQVAAENLWRRVTWIPSYVSAVYFHAFTDLYAHLGWSSNALLALIFGDQYRSAAAFIYDHYFDGKIAGGLFNASYFASLYADWGMIGVALGTILIAFITAWTEKVFSKRGVNCIGVALKAVAGVAVIQLMLTNIYSVLLGRGLLSLPLLLIFLRFLSNQAARRRQGKA